MTNTFYFGIDEVRLALIDYANKMDRNIVIPDNNAMIGFLDEHEKPADVKLVQVFYDIK